MHVYCNCIAVFSMLIQQYHIPKLIIPARLSESEKKNVLQKMAFKGIFTHFENYFSSMIKSNWVWNGIARHNYGAQCIAIARDMWSLFEVEQILIASLSNRLQCETCPKYPNTYIHTTMACIWILLRLLIRLNKCLIRGQELAFIWFQIFLTILNIWKSIFNLFQAYKGGCKCLNLPVYKLRMLPNFSSWYRICTFYKLEEHNLDICYRLFV